VAYDPSVQQLPEYLARHFALAPDAESALERADAAVIATNCAEFQHLTPTSFYGMKRRIVIDPQRVLEGIIGADESIRYVGVGLPAKR
jgi:UDP-N-acetyl-D-mannosaminuronate dehydrogenase